MRNSRRSAVMVAVLSLLLSLVAGCAPPAHEDGRTLRVWLQESDSDQVQQGYLDLVADFERRHRGVEVELSRIPYKQYRDKLVLAAQGGTEPDVFQLDQIWTPEFAAAGLIADLGPHLRRSPDIDEHAYFPGAWESNQWRDGTWGLPLNTGVWERMYYNAELFRRAGLDPDRPPRTWPQWLDAAQRLDRLPGVFGIGLVGCRDEPASVLTDSLLYSAGGRIVDEGRAVFDSAPNRRAYTLYQQLAQHAPNGIAGSCDDDAVAHFTAGTTGMVLAGGWQESTIDESARFDWRASTPPAPEGRRFTGALGGWNLAVGARARDDVLAFEFAQLATTSRTHQLAINDSVPALREAGTEFVRKNRKAPQDMLRLLEQGRPRPVTPSYAKISRIQQDAVQAIVGGANVAETLREANTSIQRSIDRP